MYRSSLGDELVLEVGKEVLLGDVLGILQAENELVVEAGNVGDGTGREVVGGS